MSEWQPISTAPKAGAVILLFDPKWGRVPGFNRFGGPWPMSEGICDYDRWYLGTEWFDGDKNNGPYHVDDGSWDHNAVILDPTFWMPLPEPPKK